MGEERTGRRVGRLHTDRLRGRGRARGLPDRPITRSAASTRKAQGATLAAARGRRVAAALADLASAAREVRVTADVATAAPALRAAASAPTTGRARGHVELARAAAAARNPLVPSDARRAARVRRRLVWPLAGSVLPLDVIERIVCAAVLCVARWAGERVRRACAGVCGLQRSPGIRCYSLLAAAVCCCKSVSHVSRETHGGLMEYPYILVIRLAAAWQLWHRRESYYALYRYT